MKRVWRLKRIWAALAAIPLVVATPLAAADRPAVALPSWMAGDWIMQDGYDWADESWTTPRGDMMIGVARTGFGSGLQMWEVTRIERKPDGSLSFFAQPRGVPASEFPMVLVSDDAIEFANPAHDFPQRIRYWRAGQLLMAEVSKIDGSDAMRWNYRPLEIRD
jgi:hypothetical protein